MRCLEGAVAQEIGVGRQTVIAQLLEAAGGEVLGRLSRLSRKELGDLIEAGA